MNPDLWTTVLLLLLLLHCTVIKLFGYLATSMQINPLSLSYIHRMLDKLQCSKEQVKCRLADQ